MSYRNFLICLGLALSMSCQKKNTSGAGLGISAVSSTSIQFGKWGGRNIELLMSQAGGSVTFNCGSGAFGPAIMDGNGDWHAIGTYSQGSPVAEAGDDAAVINEPLAVLYSADVHVNPDGGAGARADGMHLIISTLGGPGAPPITIVGEYNLQYGVNGSLALCQ
jgi:hypothetical protein